MAFKLLKMNLSLLKYSSRLEDIKGIYFVYLVIVAVSMLMEAGILLAGFTFIIASGIILGFIQNTQSSYQTPSALRTSFNNNSTILENSLPIGRKNFVKGRILYTFVAALISFILLLPSIVSIFIIQSRSSIDIVSTPLALKFAIGYFLFLVWIILFTEVRYISSSRTSEENKKRNKIALFILIILTVSRPLVQRYIPIPGINLNINFSSPVTIISVGLVLILISLIQIGLVFKKINKLDFHQ